MKNDRSPLPILVAALLLQGASLRAAAPPTELEGTVTGVSGSTVEILGERVRLDATAARIVRRATGHALGIGDLAPGVSVRVLVGSPREDGVLPALEVRVGKPESLKARGALSAVSAGSMTLGLAGRTVAVGSSTQFSGKTSRGLVRSLSDLQPGDFVEARLQQSSAGLTAGSIHADDDPEPAEATEVRLVGTLTSIEGDVWTVAGRAVKTTAKTVVTGDPKVGGQVEVEAIDGGDGTLLAMRISAEDTKPDDGPGHDAGGDHGGGTGNGSGGGSGSGNGNGGSGTGGADDGPGHGAGDDHGGQGGHR